MDDWFAIPIRAFVLAQEGMLVYVFAINTIYLFLMLLGYFVLRRDTGRLTRHERDALMRSYLVPAVSVLAPAYNEAATCRDSVRAMLKLRYPDHEVVVINDGSADDTLQVLIDEFHLYRSSRAPSGALATRPIKALYESRDPIRLVVIDKENGGKADSLNAGLNVARAPLVAAVDSDSLLEENALLYAVKPFLEDPVRTLASGGIIRVANGCTVEEGRIAQVNAPNTMLARLQAVEYLRAFLGGRVAFSFFNALLIISGAFGVFRREAVMAVGGFMTTTVGEDMEMVVRLHRFAREQRRDYRIVFVPDPVCWTEVPESMKSLHRQRNRWQRGTVETVRTHARMLLNPRYGVVGMFALPYFAMFEMIGPIVELSGYLLTLAGLMAGFISPAIAGLFFLVSIAYGIVLSTAAVVLAEMTHRRYPSVSDILVLFATAVIENFGFRQLMAIWRTQGLIDGLRNRKKGWGAMERRGFRPAGVQSNS
jgi:cellulose synthase/poly-beta-1,6-N-acetylglucosamine synthase-like glycosyltransferase